MRKRHPENAPGNWYVDTRCIDCGAARTAAPGLIVERGGQSVFARQPQTADERMMAWRARLLCPTASVRSESHARVPDGVFPEQMTKGIYRLGYNAKSAYGAHSFAIRRPGGNVMLDGPRFTRAVVAQFENWGGLSDILLTHRDDVGDAGRERPRLPPTASSRDVNRSRLTPISPPSRFPGTPKAASPIFTTNVVCSPEIRLPGTSKPMISKHSANTAGGRGPSNGNRSSNYSTTGSNGCLPDMVEAGMFPPSRCTRGSRRCLNGWQRPERAAGSVGCYPLRISPRSPPRDG